MDHRELDQRIDQFAHSIPNISGALSQLQRHDWRPLFEMAKEIQAAFNSRVRYPSRQEREAAWVRFNDARSLLVERSNAERHRFRKESEQLRNEILHEIHRAEYNPVGEFVVSVVTGFAGELLRTNAEDMKERGQMLKEAGQMLSSYKHRMLKEHKDECFERIQEVRQLHEAFWGEYKRISAERREAAKSRREEIETRIRNNIRSNREKLDRARGAQSRVESNLEANLERLSNARHPDHVDRVSGWIEEDREKLRSIEESIDRIESWIKEDEDRLDDIGNRGSR